MSREVSLYFCNFDNHIDLSFIDQSMARVELINKGQLASNNRTLLPYNVCSIYDKGDILDDYDDRILSMIAAVGGEDAVRIMVSEYQAQWSDIVLSIPCKTSEWPEEGYISPKILQKLYELKLGVQFQYL